MSEKRDRLAGIATVCVGAGLVGIGGSVIFGFLTMLCHLFELSGFPVPEDLLVALAQLTMGSIITVFVAFVVAILATAHYGE